MRAPTLNRWAILALAGAGLIDEMHKGAEAASRRPLLLSSSNWRLASVGASRMMGVSWGCDCTLTATRRGATITCARGDVAQLGERCLRKAEAGGSNPLISTTCILAGQMPFRCLAFFGFDEGYIICHMFLAPRKHRSRSFSLGCLTDCLMPLMHMHRVL